MNQPHDTPSTKRPPKIVLPFQRRPKDPGEWAYDHRIGLCVTVIAYLLAGIGFLTAKIVISRQQPIEGFYIDLQQDEIPEQAVPEQQRQIIAQSDDFSQVRNRTSNENASPDERLDSRLRDDRGTQARQIYDEANAAQQRMQANRAAYEEGLRQAQAASQRPKSTSESAKGGDAKIAGKVTVSFSLVNPLRQSVDLIVPAYRCRGGGELIVAVTVNRNGDVTSAKVTVESSSVDDCMRETALAAAYGSRFNVDGRAPEKQQGTITYIFIPQ